MSTRIIPNLAERMKQKQATSNKLAERAGVSRGTVHSARHGGALRAQFADWIEEALERFEYKYIPRGRRHGAPFRGSAHDENGRYRGCLPFV
jgi:transcriptional regulator with XRE-family HTH domain